MIGLEVELGHHPLLSPAQVPTNPLEIARRQTLLHRCRGKRLRWQQPQVLMGQPKARQALGSYECEQSGAGVTQPEEKLKKGTCFVISPYNAYQTSKRQEGL